MRKAVYAALMGLAFFLSLTAWGQTGPMGKGGSAGVTWTKRTSGAIDDLWGVTYGNGLFVAVGGSLEEMPGILALRTATILTSRDGITWTERDPGSYVPLYGVTYGNGLFVAVGWGGTILTSPDGVKWTQQVSGTGDHLNEVAYLNGLFVAVGIDGAILTSRDGITWTRRNSGTRKGLYAVTYGNGRFVAVGSDGIILTSP